MLRKEGRIIRLGDFCRVEIVPTKEKGVSMSNGKRAVTLADHQAGGRIWKNMKLAIQQHDDYFRKYISRRDLRGQPDGVAGLYHLNLQQNLSLGFLFICIVAVLFLGCQSPFIIGLSMVVSIEIYFLFLLSVQDDKLNIISLSGLILALGMMIVTAASCLKYFAVPRTGLFVVEAGLRDGNE